jgi:phosphopantetheinyl transferase
MPLFFQQNTNEHTRLGIWHITEEEAFFLEKVPVQRELSHPHKRLQHLAGRYLLQHLFPDFPYHEMLIANSRKPYLPDEQYHFSISHCGDYAAAIVSKSQRVGIDIEIPTPRVQKIASKFLHEEEREYLAWQTKAAQLPTDNYQLLTLLWSAKEAAFKWWSFGSVDFSEHIRLAPFTFTRDKGSMECTFIRGADSYPLSMQYHLFPDLCLVYTT